MKNISITAEAFWKYKLSMNRKGAKTYSILEDYGIDNIVRELEDGIKLKYIAENIGIPYPTFAKIIHRIKEAQVSINAGSKELLADNDLKHTNKKKIKRGSKNYNGISERTKELIERQHEFFSKQRARKKINFDNLTKDIVLLLKRKEKETDDVKHDCRNCAYKNAENGMCWYTMVTNKNNYVCDNKCRHFVDLDNIQGDIK